MFLAAFGVIELVFFGVFFLLMILGAEFDRRGNPSVKWYVFLVGLIGAAFWFWSDFSFLGIWESMKTLEFWKPIGAYLGAGLLYSLLEFFLTVRKSARFFEGKWKEHLEQNQRIRNGGSTPDEVRKVADLYTEVRRDGASSLVQGTVQQLTDSFVSRYRSDDYIVNLVVDKGTLIDVQPRVNRSALANFVSAWTFFWPAYALSLILGDLLTEVFRVISDFIANISTRFVKITFANVFKF